jgi:signal transduction histidine kinase/DNA-binding NarL/FixJ family response regulator
MERGGVVVSQSLRVLIVEDSPADAELVILELRRASFLPTTTRVDTPVALAHALDEQSWDVVISDYQLPGWSGLSALRMLQERNTDAPFIIVSGAIGEETAVDTMKAGAHDYVLKDNLVRLGPAVERELREAQVRRERRQALAALQELASRSALLAEASRKLAVSLNYDETLAAASRVAVPEVADWCLLTVLEERPRKLRAELCHADPGREAQARLHLQRHPLDARAEAGPAQVIRSGEPAWTTRETVLVSSNPGADSELLSGLGYNSGVSVPLVTHGAAIGALTLVRGAPGRELRPDHLGFAQELATRMAMAIDSARLYRQAREAIRARDEFLSVASHELNTPLATLTLQLDEAMTPGPDDSGDQGAPSRTAGIMRARRQLERLSRLVANLLDISRVTAQRLQLELSSVDLTATAREVAEQMAPELTRLACPLRLKTNGPVVGRWDAMRVTQIVTNLLSNACKYGAGKPIDVAVESSGDTARLTVRDQGIGIAAADAERIFECFERAVSARHYGGLGLGLYITRQVVEAHGGNIGVSSELGAGSTFVVELPLHPRTEGLR